MGESEVAAVCKKRQLSLGVGDKPKKKSDRGGYGGLVLCRDECLRRHHAAFSQGAEYRLFGFAKAFDYDGFRLMLAGVAEQDNTVLREFCTHHLTLMLPTIEALCR